MNYREATWLRDEIAAWQQEGIVTADQAETLRTRYKLSDSATFAPPWWQRTSYMIRAVAILCFSLGVFLLISYNWAALGRYVQMGIVLAPLLASYYIELHFLSKNKQDAASLTLLLSGLLLGVNIYMQAQIFQIDAYWPDGLFWWMVALLGPMFFFNSSLHALLVQVIFSLWIYSQFEYDHFSAGGYLPFLASAYLLYKRPNGLLLIVTLANLMIVLLRIDELIFTAYNPPYPAILTAALWFVFVVLSQLRHQYSDSFIQRLQLVIQFSMLAVVYVCTFKDVGRELFTPGATAMGWVLMALGFAGYAYGPKPLWTHVMMAIAALFWLLPIVGLVLQKMILTDGSAYEFDERAAGQILAWCMNLVFIGIALLRIGHGRQYRAKGEFLGGVSMILVLMFTRYTDYFNDYIIGGLLFIAASAFLFFINQYWDKKYAQ